MTLITMQDGKVVMKAGAVGTEAACCCNNCAPCVCDGADVPVGGGALQIIFTAGANAGGRSIGDVCTYCMFPHLIYFNNLLVQTSLKCLGGCNYMDIELAINAAGASGACLISGIYRIRLFISITVDRELIDCANGDNALYVLTGWEFLYSDFSDASFIGNITFGAFC